MKTMHLDRPAARLALLAGVLATAVAACVPAGTTPPAGAPVTPTGSAPAASATPAGGATATPAPAATPTPGGGTSTGSPGPVTSATPAATPTPGRNGSGGGGRGGGSTPVVATFDAQGSTLRVKVDQAGLSAFMQTFLVQLDTAEVTAASTGPVGTFQPQGGAMDLGGTFVFDLGPASTAAVAGSLDLALPTSAFGTSIDGSLGIRAERNIVVTGTSPSAGSILARARVFSNENTGSWTGASKLYLATRYVDQATLTTTAAQAELRENQTSTIDFDLPVTFTGTGLTVKVFVADRTAAVTNTYTATADGALLP